jgi:hypothetical protein
MEMFVMEDHDRKKSSRKALKSLILNLFLFLKSINLKESRALCLSEPAFRTSIYYKKSKKEI